MCWCVSLLLGVAEFCINKISMELYGFVYGFCILCDLFVGFFLFHLILRVCLSIFVCIWIVWVSFGYFYVGMCPPVNCA